MSADYAMKPQIYKAEYLQLFVISHHIKQQAKANCLLKCKILITSFRQIWSWNLKLLNKNLETYNEPMKVALG